MNETIPCEFQHNANPHHSDDRVTVYYGGTEPAVLCGFHATYYLADFYTWRRTNRAA